MAVTIRTIGESFERQTVSTYLKLLKQRDFLSNDGDQLVYMSGRYTITMRGFIATEPGSQPVDWDLNNTQIVDVTFSKGSQALQILGLAMNLRETFQARTLDELRDWTDFSRHQDYRFLGSMRSDEIKGALDGVNWIYGRQGNDVLVARGVRDHLFGGGGDDVLRIRSEAGRFSGGSGDDRFVLKNHSTDIRIMDFDSDNDHLNLRPVLLSLVDDDELKLGKFEFIGTDEFSAAGFELRVAAGKSAGAHVLTLEANVRGEDYALATFWNTRHIDADTLIF